MKVLVILATIVALLAAACSSKGPAPAPTQLSFPTIEQGVITVTMRSDSPRGEIRKGDKGVTLAKFDFIAIGESLEIVEGLTFTYRSSRPTTNLYNFGIAYPKQPFIIPKEQFTVEVTADIVGPNLRAGDTIQVLILPGQNNAKGQTSGATFNVPPITIVGNVLTVTD